MKKCNKCNIDKELSEFKIEKRNLDGKTNTCRKCINEYRRNHRKQIHDKALLADKRYRDRQNKIGYHSTYYVENSELLKARAKKNYSKNKDPYIERAKIQRESKEYKLYQKQYRIKNRKKINEYYLNRLQDPKHKMLHNIRQSIRNCFLRKKKHSTIKYLGCTISEFISHIEKQFSGEMSWENHGKLWHLDHIIPVNAFNFSDESDLFVCFNYKNYRPLLAIENIKKNDKICELGVSARELKRDLTKHSIWRQSLG